MLGELWAGREGQEAIKSGFGSLLGFSTRAPCRCKVPFFFLLLNENLTQV